MILGRSTASRILHLRTVSLGLGIVFLALVGWADWYTGPQIDFALFYLLPVAFVTWFTGASLGIWISIFCAIVWLAVDRQTGVKGAGSLLIYSNLALRLVFFTLAVLLVAVWKNSQARLTSKVAERTSALRNLSAQLSAAEDAERRKLAYDMHDALAQSLSLIKMNLDATQLVAQAQPSQSPELERRLTDIAGLIEQVILQTRTLMFDLHPAMLDDLGLVSTLQWFGRDFAQRTGADVIVSEQGARSPLPTTTANYLFRAVKELLSNAVQHGKAKEIIVVTHWEASGMRIVVDDDGCGFDVDALQQPTQRRGLGLAGIRERIGSMGGRLLLESRPGQGSRAVVEIPLQSDPSQEMNSYAISAAG